MHNNRIPVEMLVKLHKFAAFRPHNAVSWRERTSRINHAFSTRQIVTAKRSKYDRGGCVTLYYVCDECYLSDCDVYVRYYSECRSYEGNVS